MLLVLLHSSGERRLSADREACPSGALHQPMTRRSLTESGRRG